jgi:hypothetical protein
MFFIYRNEIINTICSDNSGIFLESRVIEIMGYLHILFLALGQFSYLQENVFSGALLEEVYSSEVEMIMSRLLRRIGDMLLKLLYITCYVEQESINVMAGALVLTQLANITSYHEQRLLMGIVRL